MHTTMQLPKYLHQCGRVAKCQKVFVPVWVSYKFSWSSKAEGGGQSYSIIQLGALGNDNAPAGKASGAPQDLAKLRCLRALALQVHDRNSCTIRMSETADKKQLPSAHSF